jgi:hypothetical protein
LFFAFLGPLCASGAEKKPASAKVSDDAVEIAATAYLEKQDIQRLLGAELEDVIAVVEVRIAPKAGSKLAVLRDDFELRSYKNGGRSAPFAPSQIAGSGVLVVSTAGGGTVGAESGGPVWGPPRGGRPRRVGGPSASAGNSAGGGGADASIQNDKTAGRSPLLALLEAKVLPEKQIGEPLTGLLYFYLEGKHKPKDIALVYRGPAGRLTLEFKE